MADLLVEEYKCCRDLFLENIRAMERNEIYSIGAIAAVMVYVISTPDARVAVPSSIIPLAIALIGKMRYIGFGLTAGAINTYLQRLESKHEDIGWVCFQRGTKTGDYLRKSRFLLWRYLTYASIAFAVLIVSRTILSLLGWWG